VAHTAVWIMAEHLSHHSSSMLSRFADFHAEVTRIREHQLATTLNDYLGISGSPPVPIATTINAASSRLSRLLQEQKNKIRQQGTEAQSHTYENASYVMAATADEIFIWEADWGNADAWLPALIEQRIFGTRIAGRAFHEKAKSLLASPVRHELERDLASCFVMATQLGFKGVHRGDNGMVEIGALRSRLGQFIFGEQAAMLDDRLFPEAYGHTLATSNTAHLTSFSSWRRYMRNGVILLAVTTVILWLSIVQPLIQALR
jgi:type VI secretion system protein ImpK